jgi:hypothetical protein
MAIDSGVAGAIGKGRGGPADPSALNGLGNVLFLQRDLLAAEFFIRAAIAAAREQGMAP